MQDRNNSNNVGEMVHVVCIPFTIRPRGGGKACLRDIAKELSAQWKEKTDAQTVDGKLQEYQAQAYFHPFVRRFLFDPNRAKRFQRKDVKALTIDLDSLLTEAFSITLTVSRCELALFQPDIGILLLETEHRQPLALQKAQLLIDALRRLYPPYFTSFSQDKPEVWQAGHCPVKVTLLDGAGNAIGAPGSFREDAPEKFSTYLDAMLKKGGEPAYPLAAHWQTLLKEFDFAGDGNTPYLALQLGDDRAPIMTWLALDDPCAIDPGNWVRTCFADEPGNSRTPYAGKFLQNFERDFCYDRYWYADDENESSPSRILNCGYAFSFVGCAMDGFFTNNALFNFRHIYVEMGLIAHFQKASLLAASRRLSQLVGRDEADITMPDQNEVRAFYDQFVEFTQNFWFDEISPQEQGRELFQMWREHLRIPELYDEVRQELKDLVDYTEMRATGELNEKVRFFGVVGICIAFLSLLSSIFGMNKPEDFCWYHNAGAIASVVGFIGLLIFARQKGLLKRNKP
jgi:hypothetical protein